MEKKSLDYANYDIENGLKEIKVGLINILEAFADKRIKEYTIENMNTSIINCLIHILQYQINEIIYYDSYYNIIVYKNCHICLDTDFINHNIKLRTL